MNNKIILLFIGILVTLSGCASLGEPDYTLIASQETKMYLPNIQTPVFTFNQQTPGPILRGVEGEKIIIDVYNELPDPITVHWHGVQLENAMDGVPGVTQDPIGPKEKFRYEFTPQNAGTYWYHSHVETHKQVEMGLQGVFIVSPKIPEVISDSETVIVLDDVALDEFGNYRSFDLNYMHGRLGNVFLVNGEQNPELAIYGRTHRFRVVNTANARSFNLALTNNNITVIGEDIGEVEPYTSPYITIHPGERYDILVNTDSAFELQHLTSRGAYSLASVTVGEMNSNIDKTEFMYEENEQLPASARTMEPTKELTLEGVRDPEYGLVWEIAGTNSLTNPQTIEFDEGELIKFRLVNTQGQPHPMHLHGQKFQIISRNGIAQPEGRWKDTVMVSGGETVDIALITEGKGEWVFHCHILEHAKAGMLTSVTIS